MQTQQDIDGWQRVIELELVGRDVSITSDKPIGFTELRGPIKSVEMVEKPRGSWTDETQKYLRVELEWLAKRKDNDQPWVFVENSPQNTYEFVAEYSPPSISVSGIVFRQNPSVKILPAGSNLDKSRVMNEYFVEVQVRHHLYPPYPLKDIQQVGTTHNVEPLNPQSQEEVKIAAIIFVVQAFTLRGAKAWCRGECARLSLPIVSMNKTILYPGW